MESDYVRKTVGPALALGLTEVTLRQPKDPIEYLGLWLLKHKNNLREAELMKVMIIGISQAIVLIVSCC